MPPCVQPHLDYLSPEHSLSHTCDTSSDMYSLGVLFYTVFNNGKPLYECNHQFNTYKKNVEQVGPENRSVSERKRQTAENFTSQSPSEKKQLFEFCGGLCVNSLPLFSNFFFFPEIEPSQNKVCSFCHLSFFLFGGVRFPKFSFCRCFQAARGLSESCTCRGCHAPPLPSP